MLDPVDANLEKLSFYVCCFTCISHDVARQITQNCHVLFILLFLILSFRHHFIVQPVFCRGLSVQMRSAVINSYRSIRRYCIEPHRAHLDFTERTVDTSSHNRMPGASHRHRSIYQAVGRGSDSKTDRCGLTFSPSSTRHQARN
jgi:hypothetical protein